MRFFVVERLGELHLVELVDGPDLAQQFQAAQRQEDFCDTLILLGSLAVDELTFFETIEQARHVTGFVQKAFSNSGRCHPVRMRAS